MKIFKYVKENWLLLTVGCVFVGWFIYLTYDGNQLCDCEKTETYRDGTTGTHRTGGAHGFYRYYHK